MLTLFYISSCRLTVESCFRDPSNEHLTSIQILVSYYFVDIDLTGLSWKEAVLRCVRHLDRDFFYVQETYIYFKPSLKKRFPKNSEIEAGIRRELQHLRDEGHLTHGPEYGQWLFLSRLLPNNINFQPSRFKLTIRGVPNYPLSELKEVVADFEHEHKIERSRDHEANKYLGSIGETVVVQHERNSLEIAGHSKLAKAVEQVSATKGDSTGYDILSFNEDGSEKYIEVKTTKSQISSKFFISENQIRVSELHPMKYWLYRLYDFSFDTHSASMYTVRGPLRNKLSLEPKEYAARPI